MKDAHPHGDREGHDRCGEGNDLYCPRVGGLACESCTCETPCKDTYPTLVIAERIKRGTNKKDN